MSPWKRIVAAAGIALLMPAAVVMSTAIPAAAHSTAAVTVPTGSAIQPMRIHRDVSFVATTDLTYIYDSTWVFGAYTVDVFWGFDYNPGNNHLRAWGELSGNSTAIHVQAEPLNLGDRNGVLASKTANSQTGFLETETAAVDCHYPSGVYLSNLHYSIRWPDGTLTSGQQTGQFEASASEICV